MVSCPRGHARNAAGSKLQLFNFSISTFQFYYILLRPTLTTTITLLLLVEEEVGAAAVKLAAAAGDIGVVEPDPVLPAEAVSGVVPPV